MEGLNNNTITFVTFFPRCTNVHITKDVGMMPYVLHRDFGYDSYIICYEDSVDISYLKTITPGLKIISITRKCRYLRKVMPKLKNSFLLSILEIFCTVLDVLPILIKNGKKIDIFQVYHPTLESLVIGILYKLINKEGKAYLKMDMNPIRHYNINPKRIHFALFKCSFFDIISIETLEGYNFIKNT